LSGFQYASKVCLLDFFAVIFIGPDNLIPFVCRYFLYILVCIFVPSSSQLCWLRNVVAEGQNVLFIVRFRFVVWY